MKILTEPQSYVPSCEPVTVTRILRITRNILALAGLVFLLLIAAGVTV